MPSSLGAYNLELISEGNLDKLLSLYVELEEKYSHSQFTFQWDAPLSQLGPLQPCTKIQLLDHLCTLGIHQSIFFLPSLKSWKFLSVSSPIKSSRWKEINCMVFSSHMASPANHRDGFPSCHHHSQISLLFWQSLFVNWLIIPTEAGYSYPMLPKQLYQCLFERSSPQNLLDSKPCPSQTCQETLDWLV